MRQRPRRKSRGLGSRRTQPRTLPWRPALPWTRAPLQRFPAVQLQQRKELLLGPVKRGEHEPLMEQRTGAVVEQCFQWFQGPLDRQRRYVVCDRLTASNQQLLQELFRRQNAGVRQPQENKPQLLCSRRGRSLSLVLRFDCLVFHAFFFGSKGSAG